jgi:hypothetical protein
MRDHDSDAYTTIQKRYPILNKGYGSVVEIDGEVYAISCFVDGCHANSSTRGGYLGGIRGLISHITVSHKELGRIPLEDVARRCRKQALTEDEVKLIRKGTAPATLVPRVCGQQVRQHRLQGAIEQSSRPFSEVQYSIETSLTPSGPRNCMTTDQCQAPQDAMYLSGAQASAVEQAVNTPQSRPAVSETQTPPSDPETPHANSPSNQDVLSHMYSHILQVDGRWAEHFCKYCGSNANQSTYLFFLGHGGFARHFRRMHSLRVLAQDVHLHCNLRYLSEDQVRVLRSNPNCPMEEIGVRRMATKSRNEEASERSRFTPRAGRLPRIHSEGDGGHRPTEAQPELRDDPPARLPAFSGLPEDNTPLLGLTTVPHGLPCPRSNDNPFSMAPLQGQVGEAPNNANPVWPETQMTGQNQADQADSMHGDTQNTPTVFDRNLGADFWEASRFLEQMRKVMEESGRFPRP